LLARLVANFHRRQVSREEKEEWINGLAEIYQKQGFKVSGERRSNEIIDKIAEATGLTKRTIEELIASKFKQMEEGHGAPHETPILQKAEKALGEESLKKLDCNLREKVSCPQTTFLATG